MSGEGGLLGGRFICISLLSKRGFGEKKIRESLIEWARFLDFLEYSGECGVTVPYVRKPCNLRFIPIVVCSSSNGKFRFRRLVESCLEKRQPSTTAYHICMSGANNNKPSFLLHAPSLSDDANLFGNGHRLNSHKSVLSIFCYQLQIEDQTEVTS